MMRPLLLAAGLLYTTAASAATSYEIDQTRYFASPAAELAERERVLADVAALPAAAPADAALLLAYLQRAEAMRSRLRRHAEYLHLRAARDIDDRASADARDRVDDAGDQLMTVVSAALLALGDDAFTRDVAAEPALRRYAYLLAKAGRTRTHELPAQQQALVDALADPASSTYWTLYQNTLRSTVFATVSTANGERDVSKDAAELARDPNRGVRQAAWQKRWDGYVSRADIYANVLFGVVRLSDRVAHLHHFEDAPSQMYFARNLSRPEVDAAFAAIAANADVFKDYQRLRADHVRATRGIGDVHAWDLAPLRSDFTPPRFDLDTFRSAALGALAPLGADYVKEFRALLDPRNARLDLAGERGRRELGGFSIAAPGVPSGLFVSTFDGSLSAARTVIHEGGHAVHHQWINDDRVSPFYRSGPNWMGEAYAILNELLLYDSLSRHAADARIRAYYSSALIDDIDFQLFGSSEEGELEQGIHNGVIAGRIRNAADVDALTWSIWTRYELAPEPELAHSWMAKSLMVQDPLYLVNYLYAGLLATRMYAMAERDPADFQKRYTALLRRGFDAPPEALLRDFFGRAVPAQDLVNEDMQVLKTKVRELAALYARIETHK